MHPHAEEEARTEEEEVRREVVHMVQEEEVSAPEEEVMVHQEVMAHQEAMVQEEVCGVLHRQVGMEVDVVGDLQMVSQWVVVFLLQDTTTTTTFTTKDHRLANRRHMAGAHRLAQCLQCHPCQLAKPLRWITVQAHLRTIMG